MTAWYGPQSALFGKEVTVVFGNGIDAVTGTLRSQRDVLAIDVPAPSADKPETVLLINPDNVTYIKIKRSNYRRRAR